MKIKTLSKLLAAPLCVLLILLLCAAPAVADGTDVAYDISATDAIGADVSADADVSGVDATNVTDDITASDAIDVDATVVDDFVVDDAVVDAIIVDEFVADNAVVDDVLVDDAVHDVVVPNSSDVAGEVIIGGIETNTPNASMVGAAFASYEDIVFTDWTSSTSMPDAAGNYRLTEDVSISSTWIVPTGDTNLDLNGYTLRLADDSFGSVIEIVGENTFFRLYDNSTTGNGKITGGKTKNWYSVNYGSGVSVGSSGTFEMFGGNITGNTVNGNYNTGGGGVYINSGTFIMYDGTISNNRAIGGSGGGVCIHDGSFTMYDGTISGNTATYYGGGMYNVGTFTMSGGYITCNSANCEYGYGGGGVFNVGTFTMSGGTISDNTAYYGGGVSISGTFVMSGGTISENSVTHNGGGVYVDSYSTFIMSGGNITSNIANTDGGGVYVNSISTSTVSGDGVYDGTFTMSGGNIYGNTAEIYGYGVYMSGIFTISGSANIAADNSFYIAAGKTIYISGDEFTGNVSSITGLAVSPGYELIKIIGNVSPTNIYDRFILENTELDLYSNGVDGFVVIINGFTYLQDTQVFQLNHDVILSKTLVISSTIGLDLNGHTLQMADNSVGSAIGVFGENTVFSLYDNSTTGSGRITGVKETYGGIGDGGVYVESGTLNMYGGTVSGNNVLRHGGGVYVSGGNFTMSGGNITGNTAYMNGGGVYVYNSGTFTMSGGSITGNSADDYGGGVYVDISSTFTMSGGIISGNTATYYGGGVYINKYYNSFIICGDATINADNSVYLDTKTKITISGDEFTGSIFNITGKAISHGNKIIKIDGTISPESVLHHVTLANINFELVPIDDNYLVAVLKGTPYIPDSPREIKLNHDTILSETLIITDNVYIDLNGYTLRMVDGVQEPVITVNGELTLIDTSDAKTGQVTGGNHGVYVSRGGMFFLYSGNITGNIAESEDGGGVCVEGYFSMYGGNITGNSAYSGGGVYVGYDSGTFNMYGGNISGNTADLRGGGVYVRHGSDFNIAGNANIAADNSVYIDTGNTIYLLGDEFTGSIANITGFAVSLGCELVKITGNASPESVCDRFILANTGLELCPNGANGLVITVKDSTYSQDTSAIKLNHDVILSETLMIFNTVNFDLNGYTLRMADSASGSVFFVSGNNAVLNLYDNSTTGNGKITGGNTVGDGGGVYVSDSGIFTMYGGTISGNTAGGVGGGVYVGYDGIFIVSGNANIAADNSVYIETGNTISLLGDEFTGSVANITVSAPYIGYELVNITGNISLSSVCDRFILSNSVFVLRPDGVNGLIITIKNSTYSPDTLVTQLNNDVTLYETLQICNTVSIDLNGYTLRLAEDSFGSVIEVSGENTVFRVYDNSTTENGKITGGNITENTAESNGGGVSVGYGGTFEIYGGNISGNTARVGGGVYVSDSGTFVMYGGNISGNAAKYEGGGVYVSDNGTFTMSGGNIIGNTADWSGGVYVYEGGTLTMHGGNITDNTAKYNGGGVYVGYQSNFTMYGGNITGNTANSDGGGVYVESGTFNMYGGNITENTVTYGSGGGVYVSESGTFNMYGGNITGNTAKYDGGGVCISGTFTLFEGNIIGNTAGQFGGGVYVYVHGTFTMFGGNITGNTAKYDGGGVYVHGISTMSGGNITGNIADRYGGGVYVSDQNTFTISGNANIAADNSVYIDTGSTISLSGDEFTGSIANIVGPATSLGCEPIKITGDISPADACDRLVLANTGLGFQPNGVDDLIVIINGSTYSPDTSVIQLNRDATSSACLKIYQTINLDLNGYTLRLADNACDSVIGVYDKNATLNLYDNSTTGNGKITGGNTSNSGGGVYVSESGTFNMYGGNITGNTADYYGGGVCIWDGTFSMHGGNITGNTANYGGGGVYMYGSGSFTMHGGNISGNTAKIYGGGVYMDGVTFAMHGGDISDNTAGWYGGGVYVSNSGTLTLFGGNIHRNTAIYGGGGVYMNSGTFVMSDGNITDNTGCGVYVYDNVTFTMSGGNISGNIAGDGVRVGWNSNFTMSGGNISNTNGVGVGIGYGNFTMYDGNISGNSDGGVSVWDGTFDMYGGDISGNIASESGGGVYVSDDSIFTMHSGNITGNTANHGGGVCVSNAGAVGLDNGTLATGESGRFTIYGGNITGNTASQYGGGVYVKEIGVSYYNGIYYQHPPGEFIVCGGTITENFENDGIPSNVYLRHNTIFSTLPEHEIADGARIGVTVEPASVDGTVIAITGKNTKDYSRYFFADKSTDRIENRNNVLYLVSTPSTHWSVMLTLGKNMTAESGSILNQLVQKDTWMSQINLVADDAYCFDENDYPNENGLIYEVSEDKKMLTIFGVPTTDIFKTLADASESPHSITIISSENGVATASQTSAKSNETVILTATPNAGYAFSEWQVVSGDIHIDDNVFIMPFGDVSIKAIFLPEYLVPVEDTTESANAATTAEVGYSVMPENVQEINAPSITRGGRSLVLDEKVVVKVTKGGVEIDVPASVNADGTVNVADADIAGADSVSVTFVGRKIGDVSGDGSPNTLDAAMILKASAEIEALDVKGDFYGDVTNDGQTTTLDAARILQHSADMTDDDYELIE